MGGWFANLRIGAKSALAPALGIIGLIAVAAGSILVLERLNQDFRSLNETSFVRFAEATKFERAALRVNAELYAISSIASNANDAKLLAERIAAVRQRLDDLARETAAVTEQAHGAADGKAIIATMTTYRQGAGEMLDMTTADAGMALLLMGTVQDNFVRLDGLLDALVQAVDRGRSETYQRALISIGMARTGLVAAAILATLLAVLAAVIATRAISRPVVALTAVMTRMAQGSSEPVIAGIERRNELGAMARALQVFNENMIERARLLREQAAERQARLAHARGLEAGVKGFETEVAAILATFAAAATGLDAAARSMSTRAGETAEHSAAALAVAQQTSADVQSVTSAAEAIAASIAEIAGQVAHSSAIAQGAVTQARRSNDAVEGLAAAAQKIGQVVTLIQTVAGQTNLLALNATIEAARAGEHGKGFAVVAVEVKNLASQTARATEEISGQIAAIQSATGAAVEAIRAIGGTIAEIDQISAAIAGAVEQQGAATRAIADNVQRAASGTQAMSASMSGMSKASGDVGEAAEHVLHSAGQLAGKSAALKRSVESFLATVSAA